MQGIAMVVCCSLQLLLQGVALTLNCWCRHVQHCPFSDQVHTRALETFAVVAQHLDVL
jgi:hypothetical protein